MDLLSEIESKHLNYLGELINYGASCMQNVDNSTMSYLQSFLLFNHAAINNYSEAVFTLSKDARPYAAFVLIRSLYEAHINSEYVKQGDSEKKLALFAKEGFKVRKAIANEFEAFLKKFPDKKNSLGVLEETNISSLKKFTEEYIAGIDTDNKLQSDDQYPNLISRVRELDKNTTDQDAKGENELIYHLVYRYLSPFVHLNACGLEGFVSKAPDETLSFDLGQSKRIHLVIAQTYFYYYSSLQDLFQNQVIVGEMPKKYQNDYEEIKNAKPN